MGDYIANINRFLLSSDKTGHTEDIKKNIINNRLQICKEINTEINKQLNSKSVAISKASATADGASAAAARASASAAAAVTARATATRAATDARAAAASARAAVTARRAATGAVGVGATVAAVAARAVATTALAAADAASNFAAAASADAAIAAGAAAADAAAAATVTGPATERGEKIKFLNLKIRDSRGILNASPWIKKNNINEEHFPFILFVCTGDENVKIKDFNILTNKQFQASQVGSLYQNLDRTKSEVPNIERTIFYGINRLSDSNNFNGNPTKVKERAPIKLCDYNESSLSCNPNSIFSTLSKSASDQHLKINEYKAADQLILVLVSNRVSYLREVDDTYSKYRQAPSSKMKSNTTTISVFLTTFAKNILDNETLSKVSKTGLSDKIFSVLFSKDLKSEHTFTILNVYQALRKIKGGAATANIKIVPDSRKDYNDRITALKRIFYNKINSEGFTNYNNNSCFEDEYISYLSASGFRKNI